MAIRVTQNTMYNKMVGNMQSTLGAYMESMEQGSTQKKINRPSDDPAGTYRVLTTRVDISNTKQLQENVDTAKGWLNLADDVLSRQATTAITGLKTLAEQASTGTYTAEQRMIMADQARQYFGQLINLSNTDFEGKSIFAGHKYDQSAFTESLAMTSWDEEWAGLIRDGDVKITGSTARTVLIDFPGEPGSSSPLGERMSYRWSNDGGLTWNPKDGNPEEVTREMVDGVDSLVLKPTGSGVMISVPVDKAPQVAASDESKDPGPNNGTFLYVRPTAEYKGDDNDPPIDVTIMGDGGHLNKDKAEAAGSFGGNVYVRIDGAKDAEGNKIDVNMTPPGQDFDWSYSTDGGTTWVPAKGKTTGSADLRLPLPGGYVEFETDGKIQAGSQIVIHPSRADLNYEIMNGSYLNVNSVGKDIFGGYYEGKPVLTEANPDGEDNLFEVVGAFIGYLEGNNQEGCQKTLAALTKAEQKVLSEATRIGGMENRLEMASDVLAFQKIDQDERLSYVEDVDLTELLTRLTRQQLTYQTILQSSSMIMQMSLANYV